MCWPLCEESNVLLELDLTGLFHLASLAEPIKREQDEIKRGDSFSQRQPREFSLQQETQGLRKKLTCPDLTGSL